MCGWDASSLELPLLLVEILCIFFLLDVTPLPDRRVGVTQGQLPAGSIASCARVCMFEISLSVLLDLFLLICIPEHQGIVLHVWTLHPLVLFLFESDFLH